MCIQRRADQQPAFAADLGESEESFARRVGKDGLVVRHFGTPGRVLWVLCCFRSLGFRVWGLGFLV